MGNHLMANITSRPNRAMDKKNAATGHKRVSPINSIPVPNSPISASANLDFDFDRDKNEKTDPMKM